MQSKADLILVSDKTCRVEATVAASSITDGETKLVIKQLQPPPPTSHEHHVNPILAGLPPALPPKRGVVGTVSDPPLASIPGKISDINLQWCPFKVRVFYQNEKLPFLPPILP